MKAYLARTRPIAFHCEAILQEVFPEWQRLYREAFNAGVMFGEDAGPFYGRAVIYKLQGKLHHTCGLQGCGAICQLRNRILYGRGDDLPSAKSEAQVCT